VDVVRVAAAAAAICYLYCLHVNPLKHSGNSLLVSSVLTFGKENGRKNK
jgi:hypothetical protein